MSSQSWSFAINISIMILPLLVDAMAKGIGMISKKQSQN
jgi:hypothetical protein